MVDNYTQAGPVIGLANQPRDGHVGTLYTCWNLDDTTSGLHQDIVVSTSSDGGTTWTQPIIVSLGEDLEIGCQLAIAPSGTAFISGFHYTPTVAGLAGQMMVARSDDHGLTWTPPIVVAQVNPLPTKLPGSRFRNLSIPAFAASPADGTLYVTWADYHTAANGTKDGDILVSTSTTGGLTWGAPVRVNQDAVGNGKDQFQPQIAVTASGQVNISYFDRRNDPDNFFIDVYLARSEDRGATWTDTRVTQKLWDPSINPPISGSGEFIGDYQGLVADDDNAIPFWQDTHLASLAPTDPNYSPWQEVFSARVPNLPDLSVTSITFSNNKAPEGEKVTITGRVANVGYRAARNVAVRFAIDGAAQGTDQTIASLAAGASADLSITIATAGKAGTHTVTVIADPANKVRESDETNNAGTATFTVKGNKVKNSSFEQTSTSGSGQPASWTPSGNVVWDTTGKYATDGLAAAGVVAGALPGQAGVWTSDAIAVTGGAAYDVSVTVSSAGAASNPRLVVYAVGVAGTAATPILSLTQLVPLGTVRTLTGLVPIPAWAHEVFLELREDVDANTRVYFDKVGLYERD